MGLAEFTDSVSYQRSWALLLEAATRLHTRDLAARLGLDATGSLGPEVGDTLTRHLTPTPPPPPPVAPTE
ncbi:hypothetical protein ABTY96_47830 [Streptomyces sp. NPDC096057]|uniref:hypothetical protein n=1 Tax=Streptomyces sp. NPDC096057 TaxID=3155543 RepID=UPI00332442CD